MSEENVALCDRLFTCVEEVFKSGVKQGLCGETHKLKDWVSILYDDCYAKDRFIGLSEKSLLERILYERRKRLERAEDDKD